jgi:hypothetical protein
MLKISTLCIFVMFGLLLSSCASIVGGGGTQNVTINSNRSGVQFEITDVNGALIQSGITPAKILLKRGAGYFQAAEYTIKYKSTDGEKIQTITHSLNGWYIGNLLIGGLIGFLIVDPLTGAMYTLPANVYVNIKYAVSESINVFSISDIKPDMREYLVAVF